MTSPESTMQKAVADLQVQDAANIAIVAVMGTTGSGKSTFIQKATGSHDVIIGHNLKSCTQEPQLHPFSLEGRPVALLDTPGFDDSHKTDAEVLQDIATFLAGTYQKGIKLSGIIYLQRITDPRLNHGGRANLDLFRALCGDDPLRKVVLATTFWGTMKDKTIAEAHEEELRTERDYWGNMLAKGAQMTRFDDTGESAREIIRDMLANEEKIALKIQQEMVDQEKELAGTTAGETLHRELTRMAELYEKRVQKLEQEMEAALQARDFELREVKEQRAQQVEREKRVLQSQIDVLRAQVREDAKVREMAFDAQLLALRKDREVETSKAPKPLTPPSNPHAVDPTPGTEAGKPPNMHPEPPDVEADDEKRLKKEQEDRMKEEVKAAKREKRLEIAGAVGTTAVAVGLSVINPLAIPVAFGGLVSIINACFARKKPPPAEPLRVNPDTYQSFAS